MKEISLTIGIPAYNSENYIAELLHCFEKEKKLNFEIIIVNDGSTDNTLSICKKFRFKNYVIFNQKNSGVSAARNKIIDNARGKWISFVDSDDLVNFNNYATCIDILEKNGSDYGININNNKFFLKLKKIEQKEKSVPFLIEKEIINGPHNKFYKTDVLKKNKIYFDEKYSLAEDLLFNISYLNFANKIEFLNYNIYNLRYINEESLSHKYRSNKYNILYEINKKCSEMCHNISQKKAFEYIKIKNYISCIKDEISSKKDYDFIVDYINKIRKKDKKNFFILNNFNATFLYYAWYIVPNNILIRVIKRKFKIG
ncbi:MAG: glycosyltransferase [bacterium]|nr:glycosyltransferase [bacterium]